MADTMKLLLEVTLTASAMTVAVLLVRRALSRRMSPVVMLALWTLVLLRLCLPFTLASPVSLADLWPLQNGTTQAPEAEAVPQNSEAAQAVLTADDMSVTTNARDAETVAEAPTSPQIAANETAAPSSGWMGAVPWESVLAGLWMAGAAATLGVHLWGARRFARRLRFCRPVADAVVLAAVERHRQALGVKRTVAALECDAVNAPAVFGYIRPRILIPPRFIRDMDRESLDAILLHETLHIRCHDMLINYVWLMAKAAHWFNPLVWLACKRYEDDRELRRDAQAARRLDAEGTYVYARSLLMAARFAKGAAPAPALSAPLFEKRSEIKERVSRLAQPRRTKSAAIASAALALVMLVAGFTTACQPTPEAPAVAQKDALEQSINTLPEQQAAFDPPDTWQDEIVQPATGNTVVIDTSVVCPAFDSLDITRIRPKNFTQEEVDAIIDHFAPGATLYNGEYQETKSELEERIIEIQHIMAMTQEEREAVFGGTDEELQQQLDNLQGRYAVAPEEAVQTEASSTLTIDKDGYELLEVYADNGGDNDVLFEVSNPGDGSTSALLQVRLRDESADGTLLSYSGGPEEVAQALFRDIGIKKVQLYKSGEAIANKDSGKINTRLFYEMTYEGLPIRAVCSLIEEDAQQYAAAVWKPEDISVDVSEDGLTSLFWSGRAEFGETVKENVALLPLDDIMNSFETNIFLQPIWGYGQGKKDAEEAYTYHVTSVELCMTAVPQKNVQNEYLLVPAWNFYGYLDYTIPEELAEYSEQQLQEMGFTKPEDRTQCLLTLSAVDGTLLHR